MNQNHKSESSDPSLQQKLLGFAGATLSLATVFVASSAPIPLFSLYSEQIFMTHSELSLTAVAYFIGTILTLLVFARLSNYVGRKPIIFVTIILAIIGCLFFAYLDNYPAFIIARFIQGLSCGLAFSTITTYIVDITPKSLTWLATAATSAAPMLGSATGSFTSGALKQYCTNSMSLIFWIISGILLICFLLIIISPETIIRQKGALSSLVPQIRVPRNIRPLIPAAAAIFTGTWAIGGFYQAFSSTVSVDYMHTSNTLISAAIFTSLTAPNAIGSLLASRMRPVTGQRLGMAVFTLCIMVLIYTIYSSSIVLFLMLSIIAGIAQGTGFSASVSRLLANTSQADRAGVLSLIYIISYSGAAIPNLIIGAISYQFSLFQTIIGYALFVILALMITLTTASHEVYLRQGKLLNINNSTFPALKIS